MSHLDHVLYIIICYYFKIYVSIFNFYLVRAIFLLSNKNDVQWSARYFAKRTDFNKWNKTFKQRAYAMSCIQSIVDNSQLQPHSFLAQYL